MITEKLQPLFNKLHSAIDRDRLLQTTEMLWTAEFGQTSACHRASAALAAHLLEQAGCDSVETVDFPADGKTAYWDKTLPLGWNATSGVLELLEPAPGLPDPVLADYRRHPFHLIKGSVATPAGGVVTRLIDASSVRRGADARGAMILLPAKERPIRGKLAEVLDAGAMGLVTDNLIGREHYPDAIQWVNACTEGRSWHTLAGDREFIGFAISPRVGDALRGILPEEGLRVRVESDGARCEDKVSAVTGVIRGERPEEIWLLAHLYEPLADDNSSGVACAVEIFRAFRQLCASGELQRPAFTLRAVFAMEVYGFSAFAHHLGGNLRDRALCALNLDALPVAKGDGFVGIGLSQSACPSSADYLFQELAGAGFVPGLEVSAVELEGTYGDDRVLSQKVHGVPTLWARKARGHGAKPGAQLALWHCSLETIDCIDTVRFAQIAALHATWVATLAGSEIPIDQRLRHACAIACDRLENEPVRAAAATDNLPDEAHSLQLADWLDWRLEIESGRLQDFLRFGAEASQVRECLGILGDCHNRRKSRCARHLERTCPAGSIWQLARQTVIAPNTNGLPHDLVAAPRAKKSLELPASSSGPLACVLSHSDGSVSVADLLLRGQWIDGRIYREDAVSRCLDSIFYLADLGFIEIVKGPAKTAPQAEAD